MGAERHRPETLSPGYFLISGYTNGDGNADLTIYLTSTTTPTATDFVL